VPKLLSLSLALGALLVSACGQNPSAPHKPLVSFHLAATPRLPLRVGADLVIKRAQFGILMSTPGGEDDFVPTKEIPAEDGQAFGWVVEVDTTRASLHWQEHLRLPGPPADWGDAATDPDIVIAADGRSVVAQGDDLVEDGELSRFYWALAPGDPAGDYEMDIAVEGKPVGHFAFRVPATVREKAILVRNGAERGARGRVRLVRVRRDTLGMTVWK
jgi:hypothetical protein